MTRGIAQLLLVAAIGLATDAYGQGDRRLDYAPITLHVACGELFDAPCGKVLPRIAARTAPTGVDLRPVESGTALDTIAAVCQGQAAAAIVPTDALAQLAHQPACLGRYDIVGRPLYPLYTFLIVRAGASFHSLDDLASDGRRSTIAAGADGSAGRITLGVLLNSNAAWQRAITVTKDDAATALQRIADGSIEGFFTMESLDSALLNQVRPRADARGEPLFRFIDIQPGTELTRIGDSAGHCLYRLTALDFGGTSPVATVSVDVVMILGRGFREAHARSGPFAPVAMASAIDVTRAGVLADTKSPGDWRPANTSCQ